MLRSAWGLALGGLWGLALAGADRPAPEVQTAQTTEMKVVARLIVDKDLQTKAVGSDLKRQYVIVEVTITPRGGYPVTIARDANGNVTSGIRTPQVDVPIATLSGEGQSGSIVCALFGTTLPFDAATLAALYADHAAYVAAFDAATDQAVQAGFILPPDAELMKAAAAQSDIGK